MDYEKFRLKFLRHSIRNTALLNSIIILTDEFSRHFLVLSGLLWMTTQVHYCFADTAHFKRSPIHRWKLKTHSMEEVSDTGQLTQLAAFNTQAQYDQQ